MISSRTMIDLDDYLLTPGGLVIPTSEQALANLLLAGIKPEILRVLEGTPEITKFNQLSPTPLTVFDETTPETLNFEWQIPHYYSHIALGDYFGEKLTHVTDNPELAQIRVENELVEVNSRGLVRLFQTIIYVVDVFRENNVVWGVGRGSACASYLLYLTGLHLVNPLKYNIPASEFYHS